jgi:LAS superfamily LD-carboxypeptidase LdcB
MKKRFLALLCVGAVLIGLSGCGGFREYFRLDDITTLPPTTTAPASETSSVPAGTTVPGSTVPSSVESSTDVSSSSTAESTSAADASSTAATTADPSGTSVTAPTLTQPTTGSTAGYTSRGYRIIQENGITYIDGVMIVNKTYSIPADYGPGDLTDECWAAFRELQNAAANEQGLSIYVVSGYRSYSTQDGLYNRYVAEDGRAAADTYSARPGHSEHQTGLAIDVNSLSYSFANTAEGQWLAANAHRFGFIIRYPENKQSVTGYMYEPWHIRYLGKTLAQKVYESGLCLEEYFGITSVYA